MFHPSLRALHSLSFRLILLFFWLPAASGCANPSTTRFHEAPPVTLTIGFPYVAGEDPLRGIRQAARLISFEGLISTARDGRAIPRLAQSWKESSDGLSWEFKLRPNAFFHDGSPVDSHAVKASLERSLAGSDIVQYPGLADIVGVEASDANGLVIRLRNRSTFLVDDLGVAIVKTRESQAPLGTGPYVTHSADANELVMESFPRYWRGSPQIQRVVWKAYPAARTAWAAMMRGDVDFLYEVGPEAVEFLKGENSITVFPFLRPYLLGVLLNSSKPALSQWRVRRALNYAIDRYAIVERALRGHGIAGTSAAWPHHWAYDSGAAQLAYDPLKATALLNDSALPANERRRKIPAKLHFTCILPENFTLWERLGLHVQRDLAEIGVDMQLEKVSVTEFNRRIGTQEFDAALTEFVVGNSSSRPFTFWHSQSKINVFSYKNSDVDLALDRIRRASNENAYREAFREFQLETVNDPPAIFLALGETTRAVSKRFQVVAPPGSDILPTIADWRLAEDRRMEN
jgi:peptide/nickel transport system substrate-binding protein